jgi:hypothetical protein
MLLVACVLCFAAGCTSLVSSGTAEMAGIAGAAVASAVTNNGAVASGIGLGVQAGARAGLQFWQRETHTDVQDRIADAAGALDIGQVVQWKTPAAGPFDHAQHGRVTVSRVISTTGMQCKEAVFSVDSLVKDTPHTAFYVTIVCHDGVRWKWASAEPSTERWGALQ